MLTLGVQGVRYARMARLSAPATAVFVLLNLTLGLVIVGLKVDARGLTRAARWQLGASGSR